MQATGTNSQAAAAPITTPSVVVVTVSASSRGVRLPAASAGLTELVNNAGANPVKVFPASGDRIGAAATNASIALAPGKGGIVFAQDATTWRVIHAAVQPHYRGRDITVEVGPGQQFVSTTSWAAEAQEAVRLFQALPRDVTVHGGRDDWRHPRAIRVGACLDSRDGAELADFCSRRPRLLMS
jgi:hypothetical protein